MMHCLPKVDAELLQSSTVRLATRGVSFSLCKITIGRQYNKKKIEFKNSVFLERTLTKEMQVSISNHLELDSSLMLYNFYKV